MRDAGQIAAAVARLAADPSGLVEALGLRGSGGRYFCPQCQGPDSKTPDLSLRHGYFRCHKCGAKGDLLALVRLATGCSFPEALAFATGGEQIQRRATGAPVPAAPAPADPALLAAFLEGCEPVTRAAAWLGRKVPGMGEELAARLGLRFCGAGYGELMERMRAAATDEALECCGLLRRSSSGELRPSFAGFVRARVGFLLVPYLLHGAPVYLKARPCCSKEEAEQFRIPRFLNAPGRIPCLYNAEALEELGPEQILLCEGESDTWAALAAGGAAVGVPGAKLFRADWCEGFRPWQRGGASRVVLALDADPAGEAGCVAVAALLVASGLPAPLRLRLPAGQDLAEYLAG